MTVGADGEGMSSPRKRGCFLCSFKLFADVDRLPRVSGGVSWRIVADELFIESSPRKRGCFLNPTQQSTARSVFPA